MAKRRKLNDTEEVVYNDRYFNVPRRKAAAVCKEKLDAHFNVVHNGNENKPTTSKVDAAPKNEFHLAVLPSNALIAIADYLVLNDQLSVYNTGEASVMKTFAKVVITGVEEEEDVQKRITDKKRYRIAQMGR